MELQNTYKEFLSYNIFESAAPALLLWIQERAKVRIFDHPCCIIEEGKFSKAIYIVKSGPIRVFTCQSNGSKILIASLKSSYLVLALHWDHH